MSFSRRGLIAAGLAIAGVAAIGVTSTLNAGAATIATTNETPADTPDTDATTEATTTDPTDGATTDGATTGGASTDGATAGGASTDGATADGATTGGAVAPPPPVDEMTPPPDLPGSGPAQVAPGARIGGPRPNGQPLPILPRRAPKGNPLDDGTLGARAARKARSLALQSSTRGITATAALPTVNFIYSSASQTADSDGAFGYFTVAKPTLLLTDYHSLAEITAQSTDGQQTIEVGWTVDRSVNGDAEPHLFVFHWVDNHATCYNACGFVQYSPTVRPGSALPVDVVKRFSIQHFGDAWWIGYDTEWVGYFPDSLWGGRFVRSGLSQWFGEVASPLPATCTEMGNGRHASDTTSAAVTKIGFYNGPAQGIATTATGPAYTVQQLSAKAFRFGGPGLC